MYRTLLECGGPDQLVSDLVENRLPDLVVVGAHDHGALRGWLIPDVAGRLLMAVNCDVMVLPEHVGRAAARTPAGAAH